MSQKNGNKFRKIKPNELRWKCSLNSLRFTSTAELDPIEGIVGQERAIKALKLGVNLRSPGYNIYISGLSGTGKATTVKSILESMSDYCPILYDYAYVNNFSEPDHPILLTFNRGEAKKFKTDFNGLINYLREKIPTFLESDVYSKKKEKILSKYNSEEYKLLKSFDDQLKKQQFTLGQVQVEGGYRPDVLLLFEDKAVPITEVQNLVSEGKITKKKAESIVEAYRAKQEDLMVIIKKGMKLNQKLAEDISNLEQGEVQVIISAAVSEIIEKYSINEKVTSYLESVELSILENLNLFKGLQQNQADKLETLMQEMPFLDPFRQYDVNIILDNTETKSCPVVIEILPTMSNLFGSIERISDRRGGFYADYMNIKSGSFLKANGGFLVLHMKHLAEAPSVWRTLKRVLTYQKIDIQDSFSYYQIAPTSIQPESIEIDTKVIIIGNGQVYGLLSNYEEDFKKIFKVKAEFDYEVPNNKENILAYARVIKKLVKDENLLDFHKSGIAAILEHAAAFAGSRKKLTAIFSILADLVRESSFWAKNSGKETVTAQDVHLAYEAAKNRHSLYENKVAEAINESKIMIQTAGFVCGQINGLAYYSNDQFAFGKPVKISSAVSLGNGSILNVERDAGLSGKSYDKAVLIISSYFKETFGQHIPLSFNASLVFEQSYGGIDGDSASAAEICVLVSRLSDVGINQGIAITGSVNQRGEIQPIGGVNEKIEGFYQICKQRGFTGTQGVIIPHQNIDDLMLSEEIVSSVRKGEFSVFAVYHVTQAIEILTDSKTGEIDEKGSFPPDSVFGKVEAKLKHYNKIRMTQLKRQNSDEKSKTKSKKNKH